MTRLPDLSVLRAVDADRVYPTAVVAAAFGVTREAVQGWCRTGKLESVRHPLTGRVLVPGRAILAKAGELLKAAGPVGYETAAARRKRLEADRDACLGRKGVAGAGR